MSALFSTPKMPKAPEPVAMPDPEDLKARLAKRKAMDSAFRRQGRDSTILGPEGGGNKDFAGQALGGPQ